jgi:phosphoglycerate dehydrogenase-like enzyme
VTRRVLVGAGDHADIAARIAAARPDLEVRGSVHSQLTVDDLAWADTYVGFKPPRSADAMGNVRWVHCTGAGVDAWLGTSQLGLAVLDASIRLTRTSESFGPAIAEWALARVLAFQQRLRALDAAQHAASWAPFDYPRLAGTRALIVGTGDIGCAVARVFAALGITVTGVSRSGVSREPAFARVYAVEHLPALVGDADWIMLAVPNTSASRHLFSRAVMAKCRGAVLLNAGRGSVLDESALPEALDNGWLSGAALDVFETEPLQDTSPLWHDGRVMISPHISGPTTAQGAATGFLECLAAIERGEIPKWQVDRLAGY